MITAALINRVWEQRDENDPPTVPSHPSDIIPLHNITVDIIKFITSHPEGFDIMELMQFIAGSFFLGIRLGVAIEQAEELERMTK